MHRSTRLTALAAVPGGCAFFKPSSPFLAAWPSGCPGAICDDLLPRLRGAGEIPLAERADDAHVEQRLDVLGIDAPATARTARARDRAGSCSSTPRRDRWRHSRRSASSASACSYHAIACGTARRRSTCCPAARAAAASFGFCAATVSSALTRSCLERRGRAARLRRLSRLRLGHGGGPPGGVRPAGCRAPSR